VISVRKLYANRANARASTGPRTDAGKVRAARNARRHGLEMPSLRDPTVSSEIEALAREIAGGGACAQRHEAACRIAAAQIDLLRARRARRVLTADTTHDHEWRLAALDRYERRALSRRKFAIRDFDAAQ
jgi:hypothetical protein